MKMAALTSGNIKDVPSRKVPMYVFKHTDGNTEVFDGNVASMFRYTEPYESQTWEIYDPAKVSDFQSFFFLDTSAKSGKMRHSALD